MSVLNSNPFLIASGSPNDPAVPLQRSLRLRGSSSAYLNRTPASAGNRQTWTWSGWVKRGALGATSSQLFGAYIGSGTTDTNYFEITFFNDVISVTGYATVYRRTSAIHRDPSAWYHIVVAVDTTQATGSNRIKIYVNGVQITAFGTSNDPTQNANLGVNGNYPHGIGAIPANAAYFDGYLTEVNFVDGQALTPSSFGGYNAGTNVWEVRKYSGTYGTNGFYLPFTNPASIGADGSPNGNNWTASAGIQTSNSALVTYDSMLDVPTNTGPTNANFSTLNPLSIMGSGNTLTNGNLTFAGNSSTNIITTGTFGVSSGKWYVEATITNGSGGVGFGIAKDIEPRGSATVGNTANSWGYNSVNGAIANNSSTLSTGATYTTNDVVAFALDMDAGTLTFYKNNTAQGSTVTGLSGTFLVAVSGYLSTININFGQRPFSNTPPSGFKALNTYNLPEPTIPRGDKYFKQYLYTGNGGGQQIGEIQKPASLFNLDRSLRLRASNSAYLNRTTGTATSTTTWTWSAWVKRGTLGTTQVLFSGGSAASNNACIGFTSDSLDVYNFISSVIKARKITTQVFRDPLAWNHIVIAASGSSSLNVYVNGIQVTSFSTNTNPDGSVWLFQSGSIRIGADAYAVSNLFDGYLADVYFIDGQALTPTSFGAFDGNNYWTPKAYTGTYGTNGFHLEFEDYSNNTATTIGKDTSGQGNNWTPTGINVTTPANTNSSWDSMVDVPTSTSADVANYCTLNPLRSFVSGSAATFTNGNLNVSIPAVANPPRNVTSTLDVFSGKWYWEVIAGTVASNFVTGIASKAMDFNATIFTTGSYLYDATNGSKIIGGTTTSYGASYTTNDVIGIALDMDAGTLTFYKNGVSQGVAVTGLQGLTVTPVIAASGSSAITGTFNFGQRPFRYSNYGTDRPDATFKPINSFNIAEVVGDVETPDLVRIKSRSATTAALWFNSVSGVGKHIVGNNNTAGEVTDPNSIIQFNKNGLLIGNNANINTSAATYIADVWKAGETTQNITVGQYATSPANIPSIASTVRANPISGISVVSYTGNATAGATVGHGLNSAPALIIVKNKATTSSWAVYHKSLGATNWLMLNSTLGQQNNAQEWNNTAPTPTVFTVGNASSNSNQASSTTAFCFSEIPGFSKFDRYLSNGSSTDGPFVYTGFRPRWVMIKQADATRSWIMYDTTRNTYNVVDKYFFMEGLNNNEQTAALLDINSNGFKLKNNNLNTNTTANSVYIYMAFAENPFKYALAR